MDEYILFIKNLKYNSKFIIFINEILKLQNITKDNDVINNIRKIYLHFFISYGKNKSTFTLYDLLFGDNDMINNIYNETIGKKFIRKKYKRTFQYTFDNKYNQISSKYFLDSLKSFLCQYCESQFTYKFNTSKGIKINADIDHMISKSDSPFLVLSYNNFVVSCSTCNSKLKGKKSFFIKNHSEICKPEYFKLIIKKQSIYKVSTGKLSIDDFDINLSDIGESHEHLKILEIINRLSFFKKHLCNFINKNYFISKKIKASYVNLVYPVTNYYSRNISIGLSDLYNYVAYKDEVDLILKTIKLVIIRDLKNFSFDVS